MNFLSEPLFQAIFNTSVPRVIVKTDSPHFTIIASNDAQKQLNRIGIYKTSDKNVWEAFGFDTTEEGNGALLMNALTNAINSNEIVLTPVFRHDIYTGKEYKLTQSWWQIEVTPIAGKDRRRTECLLLTTRPISRRFANHPTAIETNFQEHKLSEKLA